MRKNVVKQRARQGLASIGLTLMFDSPALVEMAALAGFHYVFLDCEHGAMSVQTVENLARAADAVGLTPMARVPDQNPQTILRFLDAGVMGVMVPHIENVEQARQAVASVKYPPQGERGLAGVRANGWGLGMPMKDYVKMANEETMVTLLIESRAGVENIDQIAQVEGADIIGVGPTDLSMSLIQAPDSKHPEVVAAIDKIVKAARSAGKIPTVGALAGPEAFKKAIQSGQLVMSVNARDLIVDGGRNLLKSLGV